MLEAGGQRVTREYYFNDTGAQVKNLGASILAIREGREIPTDGYHGEYVVDLAPELPDELAAVPPSPDGGDPEEARAWAAGKWASDRIRLGIEASLAALGVRFDVWTTEGSLIEGGWVDQAIGRLRAGGHLYEEDGATWFRSTTFGDDKDRVVIRSNGSLTYFAFDIGYVVEKLSRGFDHLIYIWGADHHGTVARVRNAAEAMGYDKDSVEMILTGWVHFVEGGQELSMSKRAGTFIPLDDLLAELGVDAARWYFASRGANVNMDVDLELAKKQSNENPVYYVQYAHARIASILRKAAEAGLAAAPSVSGSLGRRARRGAREDRRAPAGGGRGRGRGAGDAGHHDLRDGARDGVPRLLSGCAGRRPRRAGPLREAARPRRCDANLAGERARPARDLRARTDVAGPSPAAPPGPRRHRRRCAISTSRVPPR